MSRSFLSAVQRSKAASESLRATIPEAVATALGVQEGDMLSWLVEPGFRPGRCNPRGPPDQKTDGSRVGDPGPVDPVASGDLRADPREETSTLRYHHQRPP